MKKDVFRVITCWKHGSKIKAIANSFASIEEAAAFAPEEIERTYGLHGAGLIVERLRYDESDQLESIMIVKTYGHGHLYSHMRGLNIVND